MKIMNDFNKILENSVEYNNVLKEKRKKRNEAKRNSKKYKDFSLEDLQRSLEELSIE